MGFNVFIQIVRKNNTNLGLQTVFLVANLVEHPFRCIREKVKEIPRNFSLILVFRVRRVLNLFDMNL